MKCLGWCFARSTKYEGSGDAESDVLSEPGRNDPKGPAKSPRALKVDISQHNQPSKQDAAEEECVLRLLAAGGTASASADGSWLGNLATVLAGAVGNLGADAGWCTAVFGYESAVVCVHGLEAEELQLGIPQGATTGGSSSIALMLFGDQSCSTTFIRRSTGIPSMYQDTDGSSTALGPGPLRSGTSALCGRLPADWEALSQAHGLRHFVAVPLSCGHSLVGVLTLASKLGDQPPAAWAGGCLAAAAGLLLGSLLLPRQLPIATAALADIGAARNVDEVVRALRRAVGELVVATTYLQPAVRVALIRADGTAAAIFDERQRNISHARMSVSSDAYSSTVGHSMAPQLTTGAMPELLPRGGSRRSIELALGFMRHSTLPVGPAGQDRSVHGGRAMVGAMPASADPDNTAHPGAGDAKLRPNQSECGLHRASSAHSHAAGPSLHDRFLSAAGGSGLHTSFSSTGPMGRGAHGHSLSLGNTLLGESLQKGCGLWISDCTTYLQEAKTYPRDIVLSRGNRAVHSISVCAGRAGRPSVPVVGAYCVYGSALPRQLLRAVTLEVEQLLELLAPCALHRLSSPGLIDEWTYLHEVLLSPATVDNIKRTPRPSVLTPESAAAAAAGSPVGHAAPHHGPTPASPVHPLGSPVQHVPMVPPHRPSNPVLPFTAAGFPVPVSVAAGVGAALLRGATNSQTLGPASGTSTRGATSMTQDMMTNVTSSELGNSAKLATGDHVVGGSGAAGGERSSRGSAGARRLMGTGVRGDERLGAIAVAVSMEHGSGARGDSRRGLSGLFSLAEEGAPATVALEGGEGSAVHGLIVGLAGAAEQVPSPRAALVSAAGTGSSPASGVGGPGKAFMAVMAAPQSSGAGSGGGGSCTDSCNNTSGTGVGMGTGSGLGAGSGPAGILPRPLSGCHPTAVSVGAYSPSGNGHTSMLTTGNAASASSVPRMLMATPSFTVESVRASLGAGRMAPLVSGLHERLAAAQACRLVHGSAIDHQEELAAIDVLEKVGEGGYGTVYRGTYNGSEVAIKVVREPQPVYSTTTQRQGTGALQQGSAQDSGPTHTAAAAASRNIHDAFELTVSVSVSHPNIVQVLTFFTDVYVHVERPGTAAGESPLPTALAAALAAAGAPGMELAVPLDNLASPFRTMRTANGAPALPPGCDRVALLPYPNAATSCQLNSVDINPGAFPLSSTAIHEYTLLQQAMGSQSSTAQNVLSNCPPAMVICMEYCDAGSLTDAIVRGAFRMPALGLYGSTQPNMKAVYATLLEVALALRHLHSLRLVHCDLKPSNILLKSTPRDFRGFTAKLSDFGLVRLLEPCGEHGKLMVPSGVRHGTLTHMPPEVLDASDGRPHDASVDVYAFGICMWQMIGGGRLYPGTTNAEMVQRVVRDGMRPRFPPGTPPEYRSLAEACWAADPAVRPSAGELVTALKGLMGISNRFAAAHNGRNRRLSALGPVRSATCVVPEGRGSETNVEALYGRQATGVGSAVGSSPGGLFGVQQQYHQQQGGSAGVGSEQQLRRGVPAFMRQSEGMATLSRFGPDTVSPVRGSRVVAGPGARGSEVGTAAVPEAVAVDQGPRSAVEQGEAAGSVGWGTQQPQQQQRSRSLSYGGFPLHIL